MPIMILMGNTSIFLYSTIYNKRRGRISLPRRNVLRKSLRFCPSPLAVGSQNRTASGENSRCNKKAHPAFRQDARKIACGHFQANGINLVHFAPKSPVFAILYRSYGIKSVDGLHGGDWVRQFYVSLYIPPKPVAAAFFRLRGVMYLYITYYISIRIWCQYWCQWCQTLSRHQIFQKCSARSVPSIPSVLPHRFPLSFWCPCGPWLPESL